MDPTGEHGGVSLTGESEGKTNFQGFCRLVSLCTGLTGEPREEVHLEGTVRDIGRRAPEIEHLPLWEFCSGTPLLGNLQVMKGRLWRYASLFMGAQLGNLEWGHLPRTLRDGRKGLWRCSISPYGSSVNRNWREGSLAGNPEG
jgi:hypothetical protein